MLRMARSGQPSLRGSQLATEAAARAARAFTLHQPRSQHSRLHVVTGRKCRGHIHGETAELERWLRDTAEGWTQLRSKRNIVEAHHGKLAGHVYGPVRRNS